MNLLFIRRRDDYNNDRKKKQKKKKQKQNKSQQETRTQVCSLSDLSFLLKTFQFSNKKTLIKQALCVKF